MSRPTPEQTAGWLRSLAESVEGGKLIPEIVKLTGKREDLPDSEWALGFVAERTFSFTFTYPEMSK